MILRRLFSSNIRIELLNLLFTHTDTRFYMREIERAIGKDISGIKRELNNLEKIGLLIEEQEGNLKYYSVNKDFFLYPELRNIIFKTIGVQGALKDILLKIKGIKFAFIYGSYAKGTQEKESDIDLMIIGKVNLDELNDEINTMEEQLNREINYMVFDEAEYKKRKEEKDAFLLEVINDKKIVLIGKE